MTALSHNTHSQHTLTTNSQHTLTTHTHKILTTHTHNKLTTHSQLVSYKTITMVCSKKGKTWTRFFRLTWFLPNKSFSISLFNKIVGHTSTTTTLVIALPSYINTLVVQELQKGRLGIALGEKHKRGPVFKQCGIFVNNDKMELNFSMMIHFASQMLST